MKKRTLALMLSAALCVGLLAGCGSGNNDPVNTPAAGGSETPSQESTAALSGTVNTNGSTSMESVMGYLTEGFKEVQPGITVNYTGSGSSAGVTGAQDGTCDIGLASRDLKDDETGVKAITVGGVEPTEETVLDGSYAIQRNFNFIVSDSTPLSEAAQAFVDFATSADASDLIAGAGAVPVAE